MVQTASAKSYRAVGQLLGLHNPAAHAPGPLSLSAEGLHDCPLYVLPGNHDDRDTFFTSLFPATSPRPLLNATFNHQGVQFVCLDWGNGDRAVVAPEMFAFLDEALAAPQPSIVLMHHHAAPIGTAWLDSFIAEEVDRFWDIVAGRSSWASSAVTSTPPTITSCAACRSMACVRRPLPLPCTASRTSGRLPPHYRVITVRDGVLTTQAIEVPLDLAGLP